MGVLLFAFTKSVLTAYSFIGMLVGLALQYSGIAMPVISMPLPAQVIAKVESLTYALETLMDILLRPAHPLLIIKACAILVIYPLIITFLVRRIIYQQEALS